VLASCFGAAGDQDQAWGNERTNTMSELLQIVLLIVFVPVALIIVVGLFYDAAAILGIALRVPAIGLYRFGKWLPTVPARFSTMERKNKIWLVCSLVFVSFVTACNMMEP
jgi:uncharacterized membrane protein